MGRGVFFTAALLVAATWATARPIGATFRAVNRPILFREDNLRTGLSKPLFRALPDGTGITAEPGPLLEASGRLRAGGIGFPLQIPFNERCSDD